MNPAIKKSVANSTAGDALNTISVIVLLVGIVSSIIIFATSTETISTSYYSTSKEVDWISISTGLEVLIASIFLCVLGRAIAKIANYMQAIYKQVNPNFELDDYIEDGARFLPGDKAMVKQGEELILVTILSIQHDGDNMLKYKYETEAKEIKECYGADLKAVK